METIENEKCALNFSEPNLESNENDMDEIVISKRYDCGTIILYSFISFLFCWFPIVFYCLFFADEHKKVIIADKKKKILILAKKGLFSCNNKCIFDKKIYYLNQVKNVKIQVTSQDDPSVGFGKFYFIEGYIYSQYDECETLFIGVNYSNEKYNELVNFFKKYVQTIDEPLEMIQNNRNNNALENNNNNENNIQSKPEINETAAKPIVS